MWSLKMAVALVTVVEEKLEPYVVTPGPEEESSEISALEIFVSAGSSKNIIRLPYISCGPLLGGGGITLPFFLLKGFVEDVLRATPRWGGKDIPPGSFFRGGGGGGGGGGISLPFVAVKGFGEDCLAVRSRMGCRHL